MATDNMCRKFREVWTCDMRRTDRHADTLVAILHIHPYLLG